MNEHIKILQSLDIWKGVVDIKPLNGGMTNDNYIVKDNAENYVARFAPLNTKILGLSRQKEIKNTRIASENNIGPKVKKYYENTDLLVIEFIEGKILSLEKAQELDIIKKVADLLLKLHSIKDFDGNRSPLQRALNYFNEIKLRNGWMPNNFEEYFNQTKKIIFNLKPNLLCACHLDIMLENIVMCDDGSLKLIDWEYSENSDSRYDLAMYMIKAKLNKEQEDYFLSCYGISEEEDKQDIRKMKTLVTLAEATYGVLQNTISNKTSINYKGYAESELKVLEDLLNPFIL